MEPVNEFSVETLEIAGFKSVLVSLRLPFKKQVRSEIIGSAGRTAFYQAVEEASHFHGRVNVQEYCIFLHKKDLALMRNLVLNGDEHAKALRGLIVYAMINAPRYWWQEMDTYRVGTDRLSSESTMHVEARGYSGEELRKVKAMLREGFHQKRGQMFSYQTLRRIYFQRRNHRLPEWHRFCDWIKTLPLSDALITVES